MRGVALGVLCLRPDWLDGVALPVSRLLLDEKDDRIDDAVEARDVVRRKRACEPMRRGGSSPRCLGVVEVVSPSNDSLRRVSARTAANVVDAMSFDSRLKFGFVFWRLQF